MNSTAEIKAGSGGKELIIFGTMRIDAHQHFWKYDPQELNWISEEMSVLKRDFLPDESALHIQQEEFEGCVAVQAVNSEKHTLFLLDLAEKNSSIKAVVGWEDLCSPNLAENLENYQKYPLLRGFRHTIQSEAAGFMLQPRFLKALKSLHRNDYSYDILIDENQLEECLKMISKLPEMKLVIDHIAKPGISEKSFDHWRKFIRKIAEYEHVYIKLSGLVTEADWDNWQEADLYPYLDVCLQNFGPQRLMFGSDWPVCTLAATYKEVVSVVENFTHQLSASEKESIMGNTAAEFYKTGGIV